MVDIKITLLNDRARIPTRMTYASFWLKVGHTKL